MFNWLEDELNPSWGTLGATAGTAVSAESYVLTAKTGEGSYFVAYDTLKIPSTGELFVITTAGANSFTVMRSMGALSATSAASGADYFKIGSAFAEGSANTTLSTVSTVTAQKTNYAQIFRKSVEITRTLANTELYGGADRPYQRKKKGIELMREMERTFYFGEPSDYGYSALGTTHPLRTSGGIDHFISTNSTDAGGTLTESEFEAFLRTAFRYGSNSRYLFCAPLIISVISLWAQGKLQMFPKDKTYGIAITQYLSPHGTVNLVKDICLENAGSVSSTSYYGGYGYAVELEDVVYRYLQNRDIQMETEIQHPGDDSYKDQYICEVGMEFHNEKKHAKLTGVTG